MQKLLVLFKTIFFSSLIFLILGHYLQGFTYTIDGFFDTFNIVLAGDSAPDRTKSSPFIDKHSFVSRPVQAAAPGREAPSTSVRGISSESNADAASPPQKNFSRTSYVRTLNQFDKALFTFLIFAGVMAPLARRRYALLKRFIDVIGSAIAVALLSPVMLVIALLIRIDSSGPIVIRQVRVGLNRRKGPRPPRPGSEKRKSRNLGQLFVMYKFRTMRADAEVNTGPVWARENDDRITRVGRILRKTHLDEIPQFINVIKGDMCIIGPRPERPLFIIQLNDSIPNYSYRLKVKPGITGLAQVRYRYAASLNDAKKKLKYDILYVKKMCLSMDIRILLTTFNMLTVMKGAR